MVLNVFNAAYIGHTFTATLTRNETYTVYWVNVASDGYTYFLVLDNAGRFSWVNKDEFTIAIV